MPIPAAQDSKYLPWTPERVALLQKLHLVDGLSASLIARNLGGTTRSAVIAKLHRLGHSGRMPVKTLRTSSPWHQKRKRKTSKAIVKAPKPRVSPLALLPPDIPPAKRRKLKQLQQLNDNDCRYHYGDVGAPGAGFCAEPKFLNLPYCSNHAKLCYVTPDVKPTAKPTPSPVKQDEVA